MTVATVRVVLHHDQDGGWWAESADLPDWTAADPDPQELRKLILEGVAFFVGPEVDVLMEHRRELPAWATGTANDSQSRVLAGASHWLSPMPSIRSSSAQGMGLAHAR